MPSTRSHSSLLNHRCIHCWVFVDRGMAFRVVAAQGALLAAGGTAYWYHNIRRPAPTRAPQTVDRALASAAMIAKSARLGFVCSQEAPQMPPCCRIMDSNGPSDDNRFRFTLVSRDITRKAHQFRSNPNCTIAFHDPRASGENGYLSLSGNLRELRTPSERRAAWKPTWSYFHRSDAPESDPSVLIWEFTPTRMELVDHSQCLNGKWRPITLTCTDSPVLQTGVPCAWPSGGVGAGDMYWRFDHGTAPVPAPV